MSRISKILLIASPVLIFLASTIHQFRIPRMMSELEGASEEWVTIMIHDCATCYDAWDIIIVILIAAAFACIFCAKLHWRRDRPYKYQKLFPE
jgi:hypothetical protein